MVRKQDGKKGKEQRDEKSVVSVILATYGEFFRKITSRWMVMTGLSLVPALVSPLKIFLERYLFDSAEAIYLYQTTSGWLKWVLSGVLLLQVVYICSYAVYRSNINYIGSELEILLQDKLNEKTSRLDMLAFEQPQTYKNIELASSVSRDLRFMVMMFTSEIFVYLVTFVSVSGVLMSYHPLLVLMGVLAVFPDVCTKVIQANYQYKRMDQLQEYARSKNYFEKILTFAEYQREIRAYGSSSFFMEKWSNRRELWGQEKKKVAFKVMVSDLLCGAINCITTVLSIVLVVSLLLHGKIGVGEFAASLSAVVLLKANFMRILNLGLFSFKCGLKGRYYYNVLGYEERTGIEGEINPGEGIVLEKVSFSYDGKKRVIDDMDFAVKPGQTIAVVGANGAGKSTFSKLLLGLYMPGEGKVSYGSHDIGEYSEASIYKHSSAVFQNYCKYYFTVQENIGMGDLGSKPDMNRMEQLLKELQIKMNGEDMTKQQLSVKLGVEYGGAELSGGNWQKLAIARGLYRNHEFIVFDEPTASLDPLIEEQIFKQMVSYDSSTTKVYITHRMSTATSADVIVVLDHGRIVEVGTHSELMDRKGLYEQLWKAQAEWYR